jgi:hypothetical protein
MYVHPSTVKARKTSQNLEKLQEMPLPNKQKI